MSTLRQIAPDLYVAPQLTPEDLPRVAEAGFQAVLNNRPDFEAGPTQPTDAQMRAAAEAAGLVYAYLPMPSGGHTEDMARAFAEAANALPRPLLAFCRSGTRSASLHAIAHHLGLMP